MKQERTETDVKAMGRRIAELREERRWTQKELGEQAGLSVTFLSEVENGRRNISSGKLLRIADALDTTMDFLARGVHADVRPRALIKFPPELSDAAEKEGWSYAEARTLLQARALILERRTPSGEAVLKVYSKQDWIELYQRLFKND
jgi:transcriptional regulator with XRE-family HTH domain